MMHTLVYDGSFDGLLTAVFESYELKYKKATIIRSSLASENLFDSTHSVITDKDKSERVWTAIKKKCTSEGRTRLFKAHLSELPEIDTTILDYLRLVFSSEGKIDTNYAHPSVLKLSKVAKMVSREKHRMDAFVRFRLTKDNIYFATIEPDFDVLPLNLKHFRNRYADQKWIIYDVKRAYGLFYDLEGVETIEITLDKNLNSHSSKAIYFTPEELQIEELWQNYFKSTNIKSRANMKLHIKHVPKRYWKYLSEKQLIKKN